MVRSITVLTFPATATATTAATLQTRMSTGGFVPGRMDPDVASLSLSIDQHMQALTKDAVVS